MPTTPSRQVTRARASGKKASSRRRAERPIDRVRHAEDGAHPIDAAIERRVPARALELAIKRLTGRLEEVLGPDWPVWLKLEAALNELKRKREAAYFDLGFEHGFASGRSVASRRSPRVRQLAERLRDLAIQQGPGEDALAALLEAAQTLAVAPARASKGSEPRYEAGSRIRRSASVSRDAERSLH